MSSNKKVRSGTAVRGGGGCIQNQLQIVKVKPHLPKWQKPLQLYVMCKKYCGVQGKLREMQNSEAVAMLGSSVGAIK
jgi:hypothetical protein